MAAKFSTENPVHETKLNTQMCPRYEKAVSILGKRWTGLILKAMMDGPRRFNELLKMVEPVSDRLLTERLRELEAEGLVERVVYPESPVRIEYSLTPKGQSIRKVVEAIQSWAEEWISLDLSDQEAESAHASR